MERFGMVDVNKIKLADYSIKHNSNNIETQKLQSMLEKFGQFQSILLAKVNGEFKIVDGNEMFLQLKKLGKEKVQCCYLGELSEKDYLIYRVFLNSIQKRLHYIGIAEIVSKIAINEADLTYIANKTGMKMKDLKNYQDLLGFDWDDFLKKKNFDDSQMNIFDLIEE